MPHITTMHGLLTSATDYNQRTIGLAGKLSGELTKELASRSDALDAQYYECPSAAAEITATGSSLLITIWSELPKVLS